MGETSFHQMLTEAELDELCEAHNLSHGNIYDNTPPFECGIYDVVKLSELDKFVWKIIQLIRDSYLYVARHRMKG